ncbi:hypothetical protein PV05_09960 [Exophiala xenobiotica]|uniref:RING-type domain-containing protein n=1 Tax=Exophiala xenobiotica TaxID=348802 RepID=A0A0D2E6V6_9EURO|nr:uncharacterized protein PV05_09960 [Exophiala xenobiotica]KIW51218.1 hypothetical protein PV05_09960 [Exophiala xenobiotica]
MSANAAPPGAGTDVALLSTFQKHIEDMRSLSLCKICIKPFYEPFILGCGHTYCYSCLASWFGGAQTRKKNKNCPDCRAEVTIQPSPNFLLRDLVHMFIGRAELLPEDETVHEHQQAREDEAVLLAADRAGPGLFKGVFKRPHPAHVFFPWARGILDHEDNVMRCPECHWELEDGQCLQCGFHEYEPGDSDFDSFDGSGGTPHTVDDEFDDDGDELDYEFDVPIGALHPGYDSAATDTSGTDYGEDYDEEDDMDGFIERDDEPINDDARSVSTITLRRLDRESRSRDYSSAAESDDYSEHAADNRYAGTQPEGSDNENYSDGADDQAEVHTNYDETTEASENEDANTFQPTSRYRGRIRRIIISDDEDEEDSSEEIERMLMGRATDGTGGGHEVDEDEDEMLDEEGGDSDASGSDESDIRPPHSAARRMQHLHSQRARRNNFGPYAPHQTHRPSSYGSRTNPSRQQSADRYDRPSHGRRIPVGGGNRHF